MASLWATLYPIRVPRGGPGWARFRTLVLRPMLEWNGDGLYLTDGSAQAVYITAYRHFVYVLLCFMLR